ncbi:MAG: disulfide bond formation protein B [Caulobacterales bacterium]|uniref:disulfide bond formation protein B n=1 Tax=Glycocaulis sp. TaxID=1969725 RepID=UPI003FA11500
MNRLDALPAPVRIALQPRNWPLVAALVSLALLAGAFAFEHIGGLQPCPMCLTQRWAHAALAAGGLTVFLAQRAIRLPALSAVMGVALVGVLSLVSLWHAAHHVLVEYNILDLPPSCSGVTSGPVSLEQMEALFDTARTVPQCNEVVWSFLGVSMAGWNALISLTLAAISAFILIHALRRPR